MASTQSRGRITQIIGVVLDIRFCEGMIPKIYEAVLIEREDGTKLTAEAVCVKNGRTTSYYRIDVKDDLGNLTAAVTATSFRVAK